MLKAVVAQKTKLLMITMSVYRLQCARAFTKDLYSTQDIKRSVQGLNTWIYGKNTHFRLFSLDFDLDFDVNSSILLPSVYALVLNGSA